LVGPAYRADIDGLRAIAVLFVVAFHVFPQQARGGFVGVDIFFVISGYLISSIIRRDLQAGEFSFIAFYARRVRRIFPALIAVLVACLIGGWFVMFQDEFGLLGMSVGAAAGFVANFAALQGAGYFGPAAELTPLLHLWSLGIEEQFYLIWPLLVVLSWRRRFGPLAVAGIVFAASFAGNVVLVRTDATLAFYLPATRFWELMLGCGLAFADLPKVKFPRPGHHRWVKLRSFYRRHANDAHEMAAWLGIAFVVAAFLLINPDRSFPGWWALLPTVGTALLILAGEMTSIGMILSRPAVVHIGLISYPLYLWHWPILVFERILRVYEPTNLMKLAGVGAAFILADLTYRLIEKPVRYGALPASKSIAAAIALGSTGCLGLLIYVQDGFPQRVPEDVQALNRELGKRAIVAERFQTCFLDIGHPAVFSKECDGSEPATAPKVILWGDSHAAHLYPGLKALQQKRGTFALAQYTVSGCPPIVSFASEARTVCRALNDFVARKIEALIPETVIMAARWELYDGGDNWGRISEEMIRATVVQLTAMGVKRIVVIGQLPIWQADVPKIRIRRYRTSIAGEKLVATERDKDFLQSFKSDLNWNNMVQRAIAGTAAIFVSPLSTFCDDDGCLLALPGSGESVAWDKAHLTPAASEFFVESNAQALLGY
jgi:peptidoglycan/LPS O-acetylase OafA/YrhL